MTALLLPTMMLLAAAQMGANPAETTVAAKATIGAATGAILQADGPRARALLAGIPDADLGGKDAQFRACVLARLDGSTQPEVVSGHPGRGVFASRVLASYRRYWRQSVAQPAGRAIYEQQLLRALATLLRHPSLASMDAAEPLLSRRLERDGLHALEGKTGVLRELMIWAKQTDRTESVTLPEQTEATRIVYMDHFLSLGWSAYLSCDRTGTGGWTTPAGLHVVVPSYESLTDENFRVNFLAHESQHYADNRNFPGLAGWELEYRAKLVELAYTDQTKVRVLTRFAESQGDDPADAHSYANKRVLAALRARLNLSSNANLISISTAALQRAAVAELRADTARRNAAKRA